MPRNKEFLRGSPANCENMSKPHFDRLLQQICKPCNSYCDDTLEKQVVIPVSPLQNLIRDNCQGALQENRLRRKRNVTWCCWVVVFKKIWIKRVVQMQSLEHGIASEPWCLMISMRFVWWFSWDTVLIASRSHLGSMICWIFLWCSAFWLLSSWCFCPFAHRNDWTYPACIIYRSL